MLRVGIILAILATASPAQAQPPPGQSALLNGLHDVQAEAWMTGATPGCDKGWLTDLQYIGASGSPAANCHTSATKAGISIIQRLDVSGSESVPKSSAQAPGYGAAFAAFVGKCPNVHVWIVGNEPNYTWNKSDPDCSSAAYATAYAEVHKRVHALPGHKNDVVLATPNSPYSPGCLQSLRMIIDKIKAKGIKPDGFALHAYTQAGSGAQLNSAWVTNGKMATDNTIDQCPGGATWSDSWHWNFRIYRDYISKVIEPRGLAGSPIFISESGNACAPQKGNLCYPDKDTGYFQALYADAAAWNKSAKTRVRAITPYRWTKNDDGTGRDFALGSRPKLLADLKKAFAKKHAWTKTKCGGAQPAACAHDGQCPGMTMCNLASGACIATPACGASGACKAGSTCRKDRGDCVPICRGTAKVSWSPNKPPPGGKVSFDISAAAAYANVGLDVQGPGGAVPTTWGGVKKVGALYHWTYSATPSRAGTHRATFTADPNKSTVYAICYVQVALTSPPPADAGNPVRDKGGKGWDQHTPVVDGLPSPAPDQGAGSPDKTSGACAMEPGAGPAWPALLLALMALLASRRRIR